MIAPIIFVEERFTDRQMWRAVATVVQLTAFFRREFLLAGPNCGPFQGNKREWNYIVLCPRSVNNIKDELCKVGDGFKRAETRVILFLKSYSYQKQFYSNNCDFLVGNVYFRISCYYFITFSLKGYYVIRILNCRQILNHIINSKRFVNRLNSIKRWSPWPVLNASLLVAPLPSVVVVGK